MSRAAHRVFAVIAILGLAGVASVLGNIVQQANAEPPSGAVSQHAGSDLKSQGRSRTVKRQSKPDHAVARVAAIPRVAAVPPATDRPVFLSAEWLRAEQATDDRLKKFMTICRGC